MPLSRSSEQRIIARANFAIAISASLFAAGVLTPLVTAIVTGINKDNLFLTGALTLLCLSGTAGLYWWSQSILLELDK